MSRFLNCARLASQAGNWLSSVRAIPSASLYANGLGDRFGNLFYLQFSLAYLVNPFLKVYSDRSEGYNAMAFLAAEFGFNAITPKPASVELQIRLIGGPAPRSFRWLLE